MGASFSGFFAPLLPYLPLVCLGLAAAVLGALLLFAPADIREAVQGQYHETIRTIFSVLGPTAIAALGDIAANSQRPQFGHGEPPEMKARYYLARYASWPVFGILAGMCSYFVVGPGGPLVVTWGFAAAGGALGMGIINILFNWALGRYQPPQVGVPASPSDGAEK